MVIFRGICHSYSRQGSKRKKGGRRQEKSDLSWVVCEWVFCLYEKRKARGCMILPCECSAQAMPCLAIILTLRKKGSVQKPRKGRKDTKKHEHLLIEQPNQVSTLCTSESQSGLVWVPSIFSITQDSFAFYFFSNKQNSSAFLFSSSLHYVYSSISVCLCIQHTFNNILQFYIDTWLDTHIHIHYSIHLTQRVTEWVFFSLFTLYLLLHPQHFT